LSIATLDDGGLALTGKEEVERGLLETNKDLGGRIIGGVAAARVTVADAPIDALLELAADLDKLADLLLLLVRHGRALKKGIDREELFACLNKNKKKIE